MRKNRTETEILLDMLEDSQRKGLITKNEETMQKIRDGQLTENQYVIFLSIYAYVHAILEELEYNIYKNTDLNTAEGEGLDRIGIIINVARYPSQSARVELSIDGLFQSDEPVTIPSGTVVLFNDDGQRDAGLYQTVEDVYLPVGTSTATVLAECTEIGYRRAVVEGTVNGLEGFGTFRVTNEEAGTTGRNIEEDDEYRERIRAWASKNTIGTRACIEDYLDHYDGLDSYNLIPRYDGVGTLKIVCDTLESLLPLIEEGVQENCMNFTDAQVVCVLPEQYVLQSLVLYVHPRQTSLAQSEEELKQRILSQVDVFVDGGYDNSGQSWQGLRIGQDFAPSELVSYLQVQFPELSNIRCNQQTVVPVDDLSVLKIGDSDVVIE